MRATTRMIRPPPPGGSQHGHMPYSYPPRAESTSVPSGNFPSNDVAGMCQQILEELRRLREESKKHSDEMKRLNQTAGKLDESYKKLRDDFREYTDSTFSIETSIYKVKNYDDT